MMGRVRFLVMALIGAAVLAPLSSLAGDDRKTEETKIEKSCFRVRDTRSFSAVDDRHVYVRCIRDRHYLLTMDNTCFGLENSIGVAVSNRFDRVCSNDGAWITYKDFNQKRRCGILTVEEVDGRDQALQVIEERKKHTTESKK